MELSLIEVGQGNGNGLAIDKNSDSVLRTTDLVGCIAVLIVGKNECFMIHSDSNTKDGKGGISLIDGIKSLGLNTGESYDIGLIGGSSEESFDIKYKEVQKLLSNTTLKMSYSNVDTAYLTSTGVMAPTKSSLAEKLQIELSDLELTKPREGPSFS